MKTVITSLLVAACCIACGPPASVMARQRQGIAERESRMNTEHPAVLPADWVRDFTAGTEVGMEGGFAFEHRPGYPDAKVLRVYPVRRDFVIERNAVGRVVARSLRVKIFYRLESGPRAGQCMYSPAAVTQQKAGPDSWASTTMQTEMDPYDPALRVSCASVEALPKS